MCVCGRHSLNSRLWIKTPEIDCNILEYSVFDQLNFVSLDQWPMFQMHNSQLFKPLRCTHRHSQSLGTVVPTKTAMKGSNIISTRTLPPLSLSQDDSNPTKTKTEKKRPGSFLITAHQCSNIERTRKQIHGMTMCRNMGIGVSKRVETWNNIKFRRVSRNVWHNQNISSRDLNLYSVWVGLDTLPTHSLPVWNLDKSRIDLGRKVLGPSDRPSFSSLLTALQVNKVRICSNLTSKCWNNNCSSHVVACHKTMFNATL